MKFMEEDVLLRIYVSETAKHKGKPVYESIVMKAKELKLAGATVLRGIMGYGASFHIHTAKLVELSDSLPVVIEIVDTDENIKKIMPFIDDVVTDGFVTIERVSVIRYRHKE